MLEWVWTGLRQWTGLHQWTDDNFGGLFSMENCAELYEWSANKCRTLALADRLGETFLVDFFSNSFASPSNIFDFSNAQKQFREFNGALLINTAFEKT